ncbi:protein transport protein SEC13 [Plasmodium sp. gorilla clade G2]|uniref:protein transport protein SEC13 n=1 Tax=Plasmodium sp. gorilla clade G2 TaxID=880535 RepID=UPI000D22A049|nr:protein transport protein SEC13 [Plasmodium sp. gorilla clade G2]SOV16954.1 protein transport protein SEC13 [Plasmodium sp. gorilla clade G2]
MNEIIVFDTYHGRSINDCELDYYSKKLATCSSDNTVKIFDLSLSKEPVCVAELKDHSSAVWKVCWSHPKYGSLLASCSFDKNVIIYKEVNINKYEMIYINNEHMSSVNYIEWSPHEYGLHLGCASSDGTISILSYYMNKGSNEGYWNKYSMKAHLNGVASLSWEKPYNNMLLMNKNMNDNNMNNNNSNNNNSNNNNSNNNNNDIMNSFKLVSGGFDNQVIIWMFDNNTKEFQKIFQMNDKPHKSSIKDVAWKPNLNNSPNIIASCSEEKIVILWIEDVTNNVWRNGQVIKVNHNIHKLSWSPNGTILAIACSDDNAYLYKENLEGIWVEVCNLSEENNIQEDNSMNITNNEQDNHNDNLLNNDNNNNMNYIANANVSTNSYMNDNTNTSNSLMNQNNNLSHQGPYQNKDTFNRSSQGNFAAYHNSTQQQQQHLNVNSISSNMNNVVNGFANNNNTNQMNGPSGQMNGPPGQMNGPPSQMNVPSGQMNGPPGQMNGPPSQMNGPPSQMNGPPSQMNGPPSQMNVPPSQMNVPPSQMNGPSSQMTVPPTPPAYLTMQNNKKNNTSNLTPTMKNIPPPTAPPLVVNNSTGAPGPYSASNFSAQPHGVAAPFGVPPAQQQVGGSVTNMSVSNVSNNKSTFAGPPPPLSSTSTTPIIPSVSSTNFPKASTSSVQQQVQGPFSNVNMSRPSYVMNPQIPPSFSQTNSNNNNINNSGMMPPRPSQYSNNLNFNSLSSSVPPPAFSSSPQGMQNKNSIANNINNNNSSSNNNSFSNFNAHMNQANMPPPNPSVMHPNKPVGTTYASMGGGGYNPPHAPPMMNDSNMKPSNQQYGYSNYNMPPRQNTHMNN